jgi:hypothetical protein
MQVSEAVETINNTVFKPGWKIEAVNFLDLMVFMTITLETVDTGYPDADGVCRRPVTLPHPVEFFPQGIEDEAALFRRILTYTRQIDDHEDREFLKVRRPDGSWYAPLHPHTPEGNAAWERTGAL